MSQPPYPPQGGSDPVDEQPGSQGWNPPGGPNDPTQQFGPPAETQREQTQQFPQPPYGQPGQPGAAAYGQPYYPPPGQPQYGPPGQPQYGQPAYGQQAGQPPYGQAPYGPPYGPPPARRKKRVGLIGILAGVLILLVGGVLALAFALRSTELDPHAVERDVAAQFQQREGVKVDLTCADEMPVEKGKSYTCSGVTADDEPVTLKITITDEKTAAYTWTET